MTACPCGRPCPEPFAAWNRDVKDAREDYRRMPTRSCRSKNCDQLHDDEGAFCEWHKSENRTAQRQAARLRMAKLRAERKNR